MSHISSKQHIVCLSQSVATPFAKLSIWRPCFRLLVFVIISYYLWRFLYPTKISSPIEASATSAARDATGEAIDASCHQ